MGGRPPLPRVGALVVAFGLVLGACTDDGPSITSPAESAREFLGAWSEADGKAMHGMLDQESSAEWSPRSLRKFLHGALESGEIESFEVGLAEEVSAPDADRVLESEAPFEISVPYTITYGSAAMDEEVVLNGTVDLVYDERSDTWDSAFDRSMMWPGLGGADGFEVVRKAPRRGRILDRQGRVVARGTGLDRTYPFGSLAGTTIGHLTTVTRKTLKKAPEGAEVGNIVGGSGIEAAYEDRLAGTPGTDLVVVDAKGQRLVTLESTEGTNGKDVKATLDMRVQRATSNSFGSTVGGTVVMQPKSGDVLAAVSAYEIDPNAYVGVTGVDPFNRALSGLYPPGSSMKVVTAGAALDTGVVTPSTRLTGPGEFRGVRNFESGVYPRLDFRTAVQFSVNTAFAQVALDIGSKRLTDYAEAFGFNEKPRSPVEIATPSFPFPEDQTTLMWGSIGQAQDLATPLAMASVGATVANGGVRMEPRVTSHDPKEGTRVLAKKTAKTLAGLMERVVQGGTGTAASIGGVRIAGKTGTAEVEVNGGIQNHAWFVTFAPVGAPKAAMAVVSEFGGVGGQVAAPIARDIYGGILPLL
jgi:peptidoglycan glycosyltransferase